MQFVLKHDRKKKFLFSTLQGELAEKILSEKARHSNTVILLHKGKEWLRSSAAIKIAMLLGLPLSLFGLCLIVPSFLRDIIYMIVAKNRLKWFGGTDVCWIMQEQWKSRFV